MNIPDPAPIIDLMEAFRRSKTMFAAVKMGIFDLLGAGPLDCSAIAAAMESNPDATQRLLEACVSLKLLEFRDGLFANTAVSDVYLCQTSERAMTGYVLYSNDAFYQLWSHLEDAVREGTPRWEQTFGWTGPIFEHFFSTPERMKTFSLGMHGMGVTTSPVVVRAFDLSGFEVMVDLGAATGHLVIAACEAWPSLRAVAFDLAKVTPLAEEQISRSPAKARLSVQSGDFFIDALPEADLYALGRVLHDWKEDDIRVLLRRIFERLPRGGALLIAEKQIAEDRSGPVGAHMQSLNMLVCTEGKERTFSEYRALLEQAGFSPVEGKVTGAFVDAILARKS
ncbi:MAG: class I SAM-dependent methyltransferase [Terriglobia bacterium]